MFNNCKFTGLYSSMNNRQIFLTHLAQTSQSPIGIEMCKAEGIYLFSEDGKKYIDGIAGFSVANIGHSNPSVIEAVSKQAGQYMHLIVYGEFIQQPQTAYARLLTQHLPLSLNCVYFTNSGTEATEGALKLAKRVTGKSKIICFNKAYHGSSQGALSLMGDEYWRQAYRPLLPNIYHYDYNDPAVIDAIDETVACVILEPIQAEAGIIAANTDWLAAIREKCSEFCSLLIFDEIQSGFGRTGKLFAFEQHGIIPDILLLGKALGGGMPMGAFIAHQSLMGTLSNNPVLGHITTFGGHPVSCAAGKAAFEFLLNEKITEKVEEKKQLLLQGLKHPAIKQINHSGLWMALQFNDAVTAQKIIHQCVANGLITDWFIFAPDCLRLAPPLIITEEEINTLINIVLKSIEEVI